NKFNWQNGNLTMKVKALKKKLDEVQLMIDEDPHNRALRKMGVDALKEYSVALDDEEKLLFQKAKVNWLNDGDRNSAFFHKISKQEAISMIEEVTNKEVKAVMFNIDDNKATRPDGFTAKFYKKAWHVVRNDVCETVKESLLKGSCWEN
nr:RNA-directed DNA polymerase, eukaryota, reverse transcriptase zinc-binding domain protein [Tanacetum cinerariifolium]